MTDHATIPKPAISLGQWLIPFLIAGAFIGIASWSVLSLHRAAEERFFLEALTNCRIMDVTIAGETTQDEGVRGIQLQIDAVVAKDPRVVRLTFVGRDLDGQYRHLASSLPTRIGTPAHPMDLTAIATGQPVIVEEPYGENGAVNINFPAHDAEGNVYGAIGYTVSRSAEHREPLALAVTALAGILTLTGYFFVQLRRNHRELEERQRVEAILRQNDRIKSDFISTAAHELRTPLSSVIGYAEILLDPDAADSFSAAQRREFLLEIYDKGDALARIIDNLLDLSRIQNGHELPLEREPCQLQELLAKEVRHFRLQSARHHFALILPPGETTTLWIDRHKVIQVLENLLGNAVKFSPAGGTITVTGTVIGATYQVAVSDEGIGMTREQINLAFEKFYRANTSNTAVSGLGLGMNIVQHIVAAHGGQVWVESVLGHGTTVTFTLPLTAPPTAPM